MADARRRLLRWWRKEGRHFWWREERNPYVIAVVEILLKQTRASTIADQIRDFIEVYPSPAALAAAPQPDLERSLRPFGLHRQRALHLRELGEILAADPDRLHGSTLDLKKLPGIGDYAATAISVFSHGRREAVVDVNSVRVFSRVWGITTNGGELRKSAAIREIADDYASSSRPREANWALLDLGALVCTARSPKCGQCPLASRCVYARVPATHS